MPDVPKIPDFDLQKLPGVEAFDNARAVLDSDPDINPGMAHLQADALTLSAAIANPDERARVDRVIHQRAFADFARAARTIGPATTRNGWTRPAVSGSYAEDYLTRTLFNYGGIWVNTQAEANYYRGAVDATASR